ncbi:peroxidase 73-like [Cryptomeria japonica]|uniref:peroxidase 73-like n=1 Tax=Cryptomeria japonica TaxID=3369 RepID=UPI0027D9EA1B|nr:peroxidase 73-like [Cryptomeria japonica]
MQDGYEWARIADNQTTFESAVKKLIKELQDTRAPPFNRVFILVERGETQSSLLSTNFYANSCPKVEAIVKNVVSLKFNQTFVTVPGTLRLFFHDCFVEGCDASVIIQSTANNTAEKDFPDNLSLAGDGFDTVIKAKQAVENVCPNIVSCADILAIATRDVIRLAGGPTYSVELGRRDGLISQASRVSGNLPKSSFNLDQLLSLFNNKSLSLIDLISLSAAHTVGFSHCNQFSSRIYSTPIDPTLDPTYASQLQGMCPKNVDPTIAINMDPTTPNIFDNVYYQNLLNGKGLFTSDEVLFTDGRSKQTVQLYAKNVSAFNQGFINAITNMGRIGVKVGNQGQIRKDCSAFN